MVSPAPESGGRVRSLLVTLGAAILGPFSGDRTLGNVAGAVLACVLLTVITQIDGAVLWIVMGVTGALSASLGWRRRRVTLLSFVVCYLLVSALVVPPLAGLGGRVALPCWSGTPSPVSWFYCLTNRHYGTPALVATVGAVAARVAASHPGTIIAYLDASHPFDWGVPLVPHFGHGSGREIDLGLFYAHHDGEERPLGGAWWLGYGAFRPAERVSDADVCAGRDGPFRWNLRWLQGLFGDLELDRRRTSTLVAALLRERRVERLFIEPGLASALGMQDPRVRFAGCHAARHDDHVHVRIR